MNSKTNFDKAEVILCMLTVFFIPLYRFPVRLLVALWIIIAVFNIIRTKSYKNIIKLKLNPILLLPIFYILHIIGLIYTSNISEGLLDLEIKMTLFFVPLCVYLRQNLYSDTKIILTRIFILACIVSMILSFHHALNLYLKTGNTFYLFYQNLARNFHPTYLSIYFITAIFLILSTKNIILMPSRKLYLTIKTLIGFLFTITVFMLASKAAILSFFLISILLVIDFYKKHKNSRIYILIISFVIIGAQIFAMYNLPYLNKRITVMTNSAKDFFDNINSSCNNDDSKTIDSSGTTKRLQLWVSSYKVSKRNLIIGTGTGDVNCEITKQYRTKVNNYDYEKYYNAHNQYLQTLAALGIFGLLNLLLIIYFGIKQRFKSNNKFALYFIVLFSINLLFESILEQQLGIVYFSIFYSLIFIWKDD